MVLCFLNTISGLPGKPLWWILYLKPWAKRNLLTMSSGFVFFAFILPIISLLFFFVKMSGILEFRNKGPYR